VVVVVVVGNRLLGIPPLLNEDTIGGGMDEKETEESEAEEDLGLRVFSLGERPPPLPPKELLLGLGGAICAVCTSRECIFSFEPSTWNSQGVTSSLLLVFARAVVALDGRFCQNFFCGCMPADAAADACMDTLPPSSLVLDSVDGGISGIDSGDWVVGGVRSRESVLAAAFVEYGIPRYPPSSDCCFLGMGEKRKKKKTIASSLGVCIKM
jgi:hypothetical protein